MMISRRRHSIFPLALLVACSSFLQASARITSHKKLVNAPKESQAASGSYIVKLKKGANALESLPDLDPKYIQYEFAHVYRGFSIQDPTDKALLALLDSQQVERVYEDIVLKLPEVFPGSEKQTVTQSGATWGLDRIDSPTGLDGEYNYDFTGAGVTVYIVDSGVLSTHSEFTGRHLGCRDFTGEGCGLGSVENMHGTHVAGTILGTTYGVAKDAKVVDFKVFNAEGRGLTSWTIAAFDKVAAIKTNNPNEKIVLNFSGGGDVNDPTNEAARNAVSAGVVVVVAAGNENQDACRVSPASEPAVITVASSDYFDLRSYFSNFGSCVDVFAPGSDITSATNTGDFDTDTISGTSMASPHVAGVAALMLEQGLDPYSALISIATPNVVYDVQGSPNLFLFNGYSGSNPGPVTRAPTPAPASCPGGESLFELVLFTDFFGAETSWEVVNACTGVSVYSSAGTVYGYASEYYETLCLTTGDQYEFIIYDSNGDGICCGLFGDGFYAVYYNSTYVGEGGAFFYSESLYFGPDCPGATPSPTPEPPSCSIGESLFTFELTTDDYGSETSWDLLDECTGIVIASSGYNVYGDFRSYTEFACIPSDASYMFTIYDVAGDGLCCSYGAGSYTVRFDGVVEASGGTFFSSESSSFGTCPATLIPTLLTPSPTPETPSPTPEPPSCANDEYLFKVELITDDYGVETSWDLFNECAGIKAASSGTKVYGDFQSYTEFACIPADALYTFTIYDSVGDGMCCSYGEGSYAVSLDGVVQSYGGSFTSSESSSFGRCPTDEPTPAPSIATPAPSIATPAPSNSTPAPTVTCSSFAFIESVVGRVAAFFAG